MRSAYRTLIASLGQTGQTVEAQRVLVEALERFGKGFHFDISGMPPAEFRAEDLEHLIEAYRKAGMIEE